MSLRDKSYRWIRTRIPAPLRRGLKAIPGIGRLAAGSRPRGYGWLPVRLGPGLVRSMLLPEAYSWISFEGYEPEGLAWVREHVDAGDVCLDVGAHIGVYTTLLAELVGDGGHVHAFEPFPASRRCLAATLEANGLAGRVTVVAGAVDAEDGGTVDLHVGTSGPAASEASLLPHTTRTTTIAVPRVSLDAYVESNGLPRVNLLKMDIEGGEARALRGATDLLGRFRPKILLEVHGRPGVDALDLLRGHDYTIRSLSGDRAVLSCDPSAIYHVAALP